jgi:CubicO group peptidase (beta-lactamase class C family)
MVLCAVVACGSSGASSNTGGTGSRDGGPGGLTATEDGGNAEPSPTDPDLSSLLEPIRSKYGLPALSALVLRGGDVVGTGAVGVRELGDPRTVTADDRFHIGGAVQTLTATLAATLVQDGHLTWDETLGAALSDVPMHASYKDVTLADLLAQRGGAPAAIPALVVSAARRSGDPMALREEAARSIVAAAPEVPRDTFNESDASFLLVAVMLEHVMHESWEFLVQARVLGPLDMRSCAIVPSDIGPHPTVPWGHVVVNDVPSPVWPGYTDEPPVAFAPAQGMRCSMSDWAKLMLLHLTGAEGKSTIVLNPPSFDELQRPVDMSHARGWYAVSRSWAGAGLALNYASRDPVSHTLTWVLPAKDVALVVSINQGGKGAENAADEVVGVLVGKFVPSE